jgi:large subunit ribosomal protein L18
MHRRVAVTADRPKLLINRSNKAIALQVLDQTGTIIAACDEVALRRVKKMPAKLTKTQRSEVVGEALGQQLQLLKIMRVAVDRGAYKFHGRIKAAVEAVKKAGIEA